MRVHRYQISIWCTFCCRLKTAGTNGSCKGPQSPPLPVHTNDKRAGSFRCCCAAGINKGLPIFWKTSLLLSCKWNSCSGRFFCHAYIFQYFTIHITSPLRFPRYDLHVWTNVYILYKENNPQLGSACDQGFRQF